MSFSTQAQGLIDFVASVNGEASLRVEESLGDGFVRLRVSEAERRQAQQDIRCVEDAVLELVRNARDAGATHVYVATARQGSTRCLVVLDDGCGIPTPFWQRVFEPRVTSKLDTFHEDAWGVHGRGMALYSIRQNARSARVVFSAPGLGTAIECVFDCDALAERTDQSTWPTRCKDDAEDGLQSLRGPRNIARTLVEMSLAGGGSPRIYLGSPAEIVSTLVHDDPRHLGLSQALLTRDELPVCSRLRYPVDAAGLADSARALGLDISERTAQRVISGEIAPLRSVDEMIEPPTSDIAGRSPDIYRDARGLRVDSQDMGELTQDLASAFQKFGDRYYLTLTEKPSVVIRGNKIHVTFTIDKN